METLGVDPIEGTPWIGLLGGEPLDGTLRGDRNEGNTGGDPLEGTPGGDPIEVTAWRGIPVWDHMKGSLGGTPGGGAL
jgi:hypothetical protein